MSAAIGSTLQRLKTYSESPFPIFSIYLPRSDQTTMSQQFSEMIDKAISKKNQERTFQNIQSIQGFLTSDAVKKKGETLAIFSGNNDLFEIIYLNEKIKAQIHFSHSPYIEPILQQQATYHRYLVILVDRAKAKFFTIHFNQLERHGEIYDPSVPQQVHQNAAESPRSVREDKIHRHIQDHLHWHFALIAQRVQEFIKDQSIAGVIIGGHKNQLRLFEQHLPKQLREKIVGQFVSALNISINELMQKAQKLIPTLPALRY